MASLLLRTARQHLLLPLAVSGEGDGDPKYAPPKRRSRTSLLLTLAFALVFLVSVYTTHLVSPCYIGWMWHYRNPCPSGAPHPWAASPRVFQRAQQDARAAGAAAAARRPKIAIAMIADNFMQPDIRNLTIRNKLRYARTWGYDLFVPNSDELKRLSGDLPVAWAKFPLIRKVLQTHDYVFVIDADAVILREDISLHKAAAHMGSKSLMISNDVNGPNSGVFMMKRSRWTSRFLEDAMKSTSVLADKTPLLPLRFENRAFFYLLNAWPSCGPLRRVDAWLAPVAKNAHTYAGGVLTVDRCIINRRPPRANRARDLFDSGASFDSVDDAFVAHAAGGSIKSKIHALRWLLSVAPLS